MRFVDITFDMWANARACMFKQRNDIYNQNGKTCIKPDLYPILNLFSVVLINLLKFSIHICDGLVHITKNHEHTSNKCWIFKLPFNNGTHIYMVLAIICVELLLQGAPALLDISNFLSKMILMQLISHASQLT